MMVSFLFAATILSQFLAPTSVTQYVYVNDTVTFECAGFNGTGFTLSFFYGTNVMETETDLPNGGKKTTFAATSEVNGTNIVCVARMGIMINTSEAAYIYIQGPPDSVSSLTGYQLDSCCMFISWHPPFTLPGLTVQYIISVGTDQQYLNDSITNYTYCPMNPTNKQYLFNITTTNKAGNGSTSNITVGFQISTFTIVPVTQYVYINDTVTFECAGFIGTGYTLSFFYGTDVMPTETDLPNGGKRTTFTATSEVNGTDIVCAARMGIMINTTEAAYIYIQGPPDSVSNLTGYQLDSCCILLSWYPPFTLPGLTVQYIISVGTDQQYLNDSITNYTYCPMNPTNKQYLFNITTTNKAGNGSTSNITVGFQINSKFLSIYQETFTYRMSNDWGLHFIISVSLCIFIKYIIHTYIQGYELCLGVSLANITVTSCTVGNSSICYSSTAVSIINNSYNNISLAAIISLPSREILDTTVIIHYQNGANFHSNVIRISTYDLQQLKLIDTSFNEVCMEFNFVNGSTTNSIYIHITGYEGSNSQLEYYSISRNDRFNFIQCITNIPAGNNLTLQVMEDCTPNPSAVLTGINIREAATVCSNTFTQYTMSSVTSYEDSFSSSSPELYYSTSEITVSSTITINDYTKCTMESQNDVLVTSAVLISLLGLFLILSLVLHAVTLTVCYYKRKGINNQNAQEQELSSSISPQYDNIPAPQSVLSMKECAAYGVVEGRVTIVPVTQYAYINDTVTFECATNLSGHTLSILYGTDVMPTETDLPNGGKRTTFTATSEVNGTNIVCAARMGIMINTSEAAYIYIQGPPDSVSSLTGYQLDSCCMFISWYPPFTLPGLTVQYIISVGTDQQYLNDSITNYTYCPMNPTIKQYLFNITTTNKAGNGTISNITVGFETRSALSLILSMAAQLIMFIFISLVMNTQILN
uniref:Fibronectin type-III domain-containing protein n=1 Tax=Amphimedon queenslandica TaxID=400682 RepID=A0A1X7V2T8_AMPQE